MNPKELVEILQQEIEVIIKQVSSIKSPETIYEPFNYVMSGGGKRIRPLLTALSCGVISGNHIKALNSAVAIEILHNYTLVHDDIMDNSPMRRNRVTVHKKWDESTAILTGDLMLGIAFKILPNNMESERSDKIRELLAQVNIDVCEGQAFDMEYNNKKNVIVDEYINMIRYKTAKLLSAAVLIGGHNGLANNNELNILNDFADNLGIGFQIQDDVLDITADEVKLGKTVGLDLVEGKKTLLILKSIELAKKDEHLKILNDFIQNNGTSINNVSLFRDMMQDLGVFDYAMNLADEYFKKAENSLMQLNDNIYRDSLLYILKSLDKREK